MATPDAPPSTSTTRYDPLRHHISLALLLTCPVIMLLPPRKLDFYTFGLATAWVLSANEFSVQKSGRGVLERVYGVRHNQRRGMEGRKEAEEEADIGQRIKGRVWEVLDWKPETETERKGKDG
ncbi:MAG: hypothetical protein M1816_007176 [Peltula sp. TS41687]|nr:MAG: hypothetical protein M1816_007176 [Peltula sp. TS41687]